AYSTTPRLHPQNPTQRVGVANGVAAPIIVEVDEHVPTHPFPFPNTVGPPAQVVVRVRAAVQVFGIRAMKADVNERSRNPEDAQQVSAAHHAVGSTVLFQKGEYVLAVPARVAEL